MLLQAEFALGLRDLPERKGLGNQGPDLAALDGRNEVWKYRFVPGRAADQAQVLQVEAAHVQCHQRPGDGA